MRTYTAVIEKDAETGLLVGYVLGFPAAHSQAGGSDRSEAEPRRGCRDVPRGRRSASGTEFVGTSEIGVARLSQLPVLEGHRALVRRRQAPLR